MRTDKKYQKRRQAKIARHKKRRAIRQAEAREENRKASKDAFQAFRHTLLGAMLARFITEQKIGDSDEKGVKEKDS